MHVFLSYSRRDAVFVGRLADDLAAREIDPWLDTDDLPTEDDDRWRRAVVQGIRESVAVVLVLSPDSVQSGAVERELTIAAEMARRIIPIVHRACELSDGLMFELAGLQRTDFVNQPYEDALDELVQRISAGSPTRIGGPPTSGAGDGAQAAPSTRGSERNARADVTAGSGAGTSLRTPPIDHAAQAVDPPRARRRTPRVVATVASLAAVVVAALAGIGFLRDQDAADTDDRDATPTVNERSPATIEPPEATVVQDGSDPTLSDDTTPDDAESSAPGPWESATATFERHDGTTAIVQATTVTVGCRIGNIEFVNGQTVSLEIVEHIRFDTHYPDSNSTDAVVTLLNGRELAEPIRTYNCPIAGTTDLGPLNIPLDDIRHITFHR